MKDRMATRNQRIVERQLTSGAAADGKLPFSELHVVMKVAKAKLHVRLGRDRSRSMQKPRSVAFLEIEAAFAGKTDERREGMSSQARFTLSPGEPARERVIPESGSVVLMGLEPNFTSKGGIHEPSGLVEPASWNRAPQESLPTWVCAKGSSATFCVSVSRRVMTEASSGLNATPRAL